MSEFFVYEMKPTRDMDTQTTSRGANTEDSSVEDPDHPRVTATRSDQSGHGARRTGEPNRFNYYRSDQAISTSTPSNTERGTATSTPPNTPTREEEQSTSRAYSAGKSSLNTLSPSTTTLDREVKRYINTRESVAHTYQYYPGTEHIVYNYMEERPEIHSTNLIESTAHLIKGSLGAGVLGMHEAYMYGGLWTSLGFTFVIGFLVSYSMNMLAKSAQIMYGRIRMSRLSYPDLAEVAAATGPWHCLRKHSKAFRYTVDLCLLLEMCGTCCIYQIMIAHTLKQVIEGVDSNFSSESLLNLRLYILIITPGLLLLCMIRSLKFLAPFSLLADIFVGMCVLTTLYYSIRAADNISERPAWKSLHGFIKFIGICLYCTCGVGVTLPVENNMKKPRYFRVVLQYAMTIVILLTCLTGFFGYWGWGEECRSPITVHMPLNTFTTILQFLLVTMLSTTFAVQFWVPFRIVWYYIVKKYKRRQAMWERFCRLVMAIIVSAMSIAFPNLIPVMIFLGQFFMGFVTFVFPSIIDHLVIWSGDLEERKTWILLKNIFLITLGLFLSGSAFYSIRA